MNHRLFAISIALAASIALSACGGSSSSLPDALSFGKHHGSGSTPIQHVVMIVQENRSFDNFFATFPGANGATRGKEKVKVKGVWTTKWVKLKPANLVQKKDLTHCSAAFKVAYDGGKMDAFNLEHQEASAAKAAPWVMVSPQVSSPIITSNHRKSSRIGTSRRSGFWPTRCSKLRAVEASPHIKISSAAGR